MVPHGASCVGLISMQNHFKKAFTAEQAEVLVTGMVEAHDQLVTREDFHELKTVVERLAISQERTEERIDRLAAAQERTPSLQVFRHCRGASVRATLVRKP